MKVIDYKAESDKYDIISVNNEIHAIGGGTPEFILEDGSCLIFGSVDLYAEFIRITKYFNLSTNEIHIEELDQILLAEDDVDPNRYMYRNKRVNEIRLYNFGVLSNILDNNSYLDVVRIFREQ